jgi:hypothetical protein
LPGSQPDRAFCIAYGLGAERARRQAGATFVLLAGIGIFGITRMTRWIFTLLKEIAKTRASAESIRLLLKEYEHRGVGWLWQVDADNRVIYISSRMTGLIGRSPRRWSAILCRPRSAAAARSAKPCSPASRSQISRWS